MKPGRELDALVAEKVMGWRVVREPQDDGYGGPPLPKPFLWAIGDGTPAVFREGQEPQPWSPSRDIAAAWEVVEKVSGSYFILDFDSGYWSAEFSPSGMGMRGTTAPHAICLAALKAVGG